MNEGNGRSLVKGNEGQGTLPAESSLNLGRIDVLDLSSLSEAQRAELHIQLASGLIDVKKKAAELQVDVGALDAALSSFTDQASKASASGISATIQHSQTSSLGRTEVIVGNTDKAASGKLSRSALGEQDKTIWIIGIVAVAVLVVVFLMTGR